MFSESTIKFSALSASYVSTSFSSLGGLLQNLVNLLSNQFSEKVTDLVHFDEGLLVMNTYHVYVVAMGVTCHASRVESVWSDPHQIFSTV